MAKRGGASDINGFISFASNPKKTNSKTKTTVKRQSTLNDDGKLETERKKKQKESSTKTNKEGALEKYGDKTKIRDERYDHKTEQKKNEKVKAKEKEKEKLVKTSREKKTVSSKQNSEVTRIKDKDRNTADNKVHRSKASSNKRTDESLSKTKTEKNTKVSSTPKKSNERSGTATLSRGSRTSKALPIIDKKDDDKYNEKQKTTGVYDPRKKERELEKKAKESLEKIYKLNSLIKSKNSKTTNDKMKAKKQKNDNNKSKKEQSTPTRGHERVESIEDKNNTNVINKNSNENETLVKSPVLSPNHSIQTEVDNKAAGVSFLGESSIKVEEKSEDEYEDDFESYESDFEECTESGVSEDETFSITTEEYDETDSDSCSNIQEKPTIEEERKLDSGNYDLATQKQRRQINEIKDAMLKENSLYNLGQSSRNEKTVTDEMPIKTSNDNFFINFTSARQRQKKEKVKAAIQNRGDKLLEMIRLDMMSFSILDLPAVPYEVYIQCYGKSNNVQMHTQTNEENLSEEVQTEDIKVCSKWTQHPVAFYTTTSESQDLLQCFAKERLGVGGDDIDTENEGYIYNNPINSLRLHNFFSAAAEVMLVLLEEEEESMRMKCKSVLSQKEKNLGFSDGHIPILVNNVEFLEERRIKLIQFSLTAQNQIVAVHEASKTMAVLKQESHSLMEESLGRCMISVWSIHEPSMPQKILASPDEVSTVIFYENFVIAGLKDGSVCLWDLREKSIWHKRTGVQGAEWTLHSPTFITAKVLSESAHGSTVVSIHCLNNKTEEKTEFTSVTQVATLEEEGILIIWTVVNLSKLLHQDCSVNSNIPGLAPWGRVRLVSSTSIDVTACFSRSFDTKLQFRVMAVNNNHIYIGTNVGLVAHCIQPSGKTQPLIYRTKLEDTSSINCVEPSPDGNPMFLVGTNGGRVRLYLNRFEFPLVDVAGTVANPGPAIISLQWSLHRAGVFFILDENSCLHIWDLCKSDIFPLFSVPMNNALVSTIQISPHKETQFLAIGTDKGAVEIHKLTSELGQQSIEIQKKEKEIFSHYISIL